MSTEEIRFHLKSKSKPKNVMLIEMARFGGAAVMFGAMYLILVMFFSL
jgi:hypothetical protein